MKQTFMRVALAVMAALSIGSTIHAGRGGAIAGGIFAGALTGALIANAASSDAYYDTPVYEAYYPETTRYGVYDYPTYVYYPGYAYNVETFRYIRIQQVTITPIKW